MVVVVDFNVSMSVVLPRNNSGHFAGVVNGFACYYVITLASGWALPACVRIAQVTVSFFFYHSLFLLGSNVINTLPF